MYDPHMYDSVEKAAARHYTDTLPVSEGGSFWARLFDFSFTTFITPQLVSAIYVLGMVLALIVAVGGLIVALSEGFWAFIWGLVMTPVWLAVVFVLLRVVLEVAIVLFRTAQATIETAHNTAEASTHGSHD